MLRNRSDQFGKNIVRDLLALGGDPRTEQEVRTRETLLLRLLGRPVDRLAATRDLKDLEPDAVEHRVAYEWLVRLHSELRKVDSSTLVKDEREFVMGAWLEERDRKLVEKERRDANGGFLRKLCEKRLGRPLTKDEQTFVAKKLRVEGFERLSDLLLDMSRAYVVQWLQPNE